MTPNSNQDLVTRSDNFDEKLKGTEIHRNVEALMTSGARLKRLLKYVSISIVLELILVIAFAITFTIVQVNKSAIESAASAVKTSCEAGNDFRQDNLVLWKYLLSIPRDPTRPALTDNEQIQVTEFSKFVDRTFKARDCSNLT